MVIDNSPKRVLQLRNDVLYRAARDHVGIRSKLVVANDRWGRGELSDTEYASYLNTMEGRIRQLPAFAMLEWSDGW